MEQLLETAQSLRELCAQIINQIQRNKIGLEQIEYYWHELEVGDYSLMSALHEAWHDIKETTTETGETAQ